MSAHTPTKVTRIKVHSLSSFGITQEAIAKYIGITVPTLTKHYPDEIRLAHLDKVIQVANALFHNAVDEGHVGAQIFWLKTQAKWRETDRPDDDDKDIEEIDRIQITVVSGEVDHD